MGGRKEEHKQRNRGVKELKRWQKDRRNAMDKVTRKRRHRNRRKRNWRGVA